MTPFPSEIDPPEDGGNWYWDFQCPNCQVIECEVYHGLTDTWLPGTMARTQLITSGGQWFSVTIAAALVRDLPGMLVPDDKTSVMFPVFPHYIHVPNPPETLTLVWYEHTEPKPDPFARYTDDRRRERVVPFDSFDWVYDKQAI